MAVKIRLKRTGMPKQPNYRIVVSDSRNPRDGANIANVGYYAPFKPEKPLHVDIELYREWVAKGAKPTDAVRKLVKQFEKRGETVEVKEPAKKPVAKTGEPVADKEPAAEASANETT